MPAISVVIPVYNADKYLARCLDSLLAQTMTDWQAICVNDGSRDNSLEILREYAARDKRIQIIDKKNAGVSAARNDGMAVATGEFIHFMDADDFIDAQYYEHMFVTANDADVDIACSGFVTDTRFARDIVYRRQTKLTNLRDMVRDTYMLTDSYVWRYLFRREFLEKNKLKFDTSLSSQEDAVFVMMAFERAGALVIVPYVSYHYMFNDASTLNLRDAAHQQKMKQQYKIGKAYRRDFAKRNNISGLWRWRKILRKIQRS